MSVESGVSLGCLRGVKGLELASGGVGRLNTSTFWGGGWVKNLWGVVSKPLFPLPDLPDGGERGA